MDPQNAQVVAGYLANELQYEYQITRKLLSALPDAKHGWKPHDKGMSAGQLAWHLASVDVWFLESLAAGAFAHEEPPEESRTTAQIVEFYDRNFPAAIEKVSALSAEALAKSLDFLGLMTAPAVALLGLALKHSVHHRGQLSTYLRALGEKVPSIYGGSADEPVHAAARAEGA